MTTRIAKKGLAPALAKRNVAAAAAKRDRLRREARELLARIARRKKEITEAFYEVGEALARLKHKEMIAALGRRSFAEVCEKDAGISAATGERLVDVAASMTREQALAMGQKKAMAMVSLAEATRAADTPAGLYRKKRIGLPGGGSLIPREASANEIERVAAEVRHRRGGGRDGDAHARRGRTTTAEERTLAALLERKLRQLGLERARVTAVATKPGQGADLRFEHIPAAKIDALTRLRSVADSSFITGDERLHQR